MWIRGDRHRTRAKWFTAGKRKKKTSITNHKKIVGRGTIHVTRRGRRNWMEGLKFGARWVFANATVGEKGGQND